MMAMGTLRLWLMLLMEKFRLPTNTELFGETIRASEAMAKVNPFRFSTKHQDDESGFCTMGIDITMRVREGGYPGTRLKNRVD